jgi:3,4-dihydroxy-2-butanone 4-phosphate synthase
MLPLVRPRRREMRVMRTTQRGVICEVVNDDGTMAHVPNLIPFWRKHD